jgi:hypothetical protein
MDIQAQWLLIAGILGVLIVVWILAGKPDGTQIFLSLLSPLHLLDTISFRIGEVADDEKQPTIKRTFARLTRFIGLKTLFIIVVCALIFIIYGRIIRQVFRWY